MQKERKPPINLEELEKSNETHKQGKLSYMSGGRKTPGSKFGLQMVLVIVLSVVLSVFATTKLVPTKADISGLSTRITTLGAIQSRVEALSATVGTLVKQETLNGYVKVSDLSPLNADIASLKAQAVQPTVKPATPTPTPPIVGGTVKAEVAPMGLPINFPVGISDTDNSTAVLRVKLSNETGRPVSNVGLVVTLTSNFPLPKGTPTLDTWKYINSGSYTLVFLGSGVSLGVGETRVMYLQLNFKADKGASTTTPTTLTPSILVDSYNLLP